MNKESYAFHKWGEDDTQYIAIKEKQVIDRAVTAASVESGLSPASIVGPTRLEAFVDARFVTYTICMESGIFSYSQLGKCLGKDHGSVMNGVAKSRERLAGESGQSHKRFRDLYGRTKRRYERYASDPERMVQELSVHDGR